ncbi:MAG: hypothetical protein HQ564_08650 [Candidatus Saganbacteria bacterium]|nr:hypothetical protein [Candidatus Saganbacteria bacterium]
MRINQNTPKSPGIGNKAVAGVINPPINRPNKIQIEQINSRLTQLKLTLAPLISQKQTMGIERRQIFESIQNLELQINIRKQHFDQTDERADIKGFLEAFDALRSSQKNHEALLGSYKAKKESIQGINREIQSHYPEIKEIMQEKERVVSGPAINDDTFISNFTPVEIFKQHQALGDLVFSLRLYPQDNMVRWILINEINIVNIAHCDPNIEMDHHIVPPHQVVPIESYDTREEDLFFPPSSSNQSFKLEMATVIQTLPPEIEQDPDAIALRDRVRESRQPLLFTRNMGLEEFENIAVENSMRSGRRGTNYLRYGLGHEYGNIVAVMKRGYHEKARSRGINIKNIFLDEVDGERAPGREFKQLGDRDTWDGGMIHVDGIVDPDDEHAFLLRLANKVNFNRYLGEQESTNSWVQDIPAHGKTIIMEHQEEYMGLYPQIEDRNDIDLDDIETFLVPEHLWEEACQIAQNNPKLTSLLRKVEGSGRSEEDFLHSIDSLVRRSRTYGGGFNPMFGYHSFFLFEQEYLKLVLDEDASQSAYSLFQKYGYIGSPRSCWIDGKPVQQPTVRYGRNREDWKIFVNPRKEHFFSIFEKVLEVLSQNSNLGIEFKIAANLSHEWRRGRIFGTSSDTPKIILYLNADTLPIIMHALDEQMPRDAGFGNVPGPSFAKQYGSSDLLFYKMECFGPGGDVRAEIGKRVEREALAAGITDFDKIRRLQIKEIIKAGFIGENSYMTPNTSDPLLQ